MSKAVKYSIWILSLLAILIAGFLFYSFAGHVVIAEYIKRENNPNLYFSFSRCTDAPDARHEVLSTEWKKNGSFVVKGVATPGCGTTWIFGDY